MLFRSTPCLAKILGGPIFNANGLNLGSGLDAGGGFEQLVTSGSCPSQPAILAGPYTCKSSVPQSILDYQTNAKLPATKPALSSTNGGPITVSVPGNVACPSYKVFQPGTYTSNPSFTKNTTHFFVSGVYKIGRAHV